MNHNRNATLLRAFINEVQETGIFPHPEIINIFEQHQQQLTQPRKIPPFPHLPTPPEKTPETPAKITTPQQQPENPPETTITPPKSQSLITSDSDYSSEKELLPNAQFSPPPKEEKNPPDDNHNYGIYLENPHTSLAQNFSENYFIPHPHNFANNPETVIPIHQEIDYPSSETSPSQSLKYDNPQTISRKKRIITRDEKLIQSYIEYVRKTGDCEYPLLEKQLLHN
ncbi:hypothetical protein IQ215_03570 [Cyanobacterium stanieri LEGE 03274]|uniref:Uncharacterized protein n=1 Tax=Cyanobacterium stanieri LEGE 03274 TaxID=1828756 RepID=A0ABR9V3Q2_9CHRO|nr:hypothetical protein [Cyanobacterium stanieri]MBE9221766.1 hypothetical protein [Cyanobacterium stanieri LEGE 03274]